jgi:hypothetical protein
MLFALLIGMAFNFLADPPEGRDRSGIFVPDPAAG